MKQTFRLSLLMAGLLLASSGAYAQQWEERIVNGDFEGSDLSSFAIDIKGEGTHNLESTDIVVDDDDANNHCAKISFTANPWNTQFIIQLTEPLSEGDRIQFSMRVKTSSERDIAVISDELKNFSVKGGGIWNTCTYEGVVSTDHNGCQTITLYFTRTSKKTDILHFDDISLKVLKDAPIKFADAKVKETCVALWDTNMDGELSLYEAAAVKELYPNLFLGRKDITSFDELQFFVGLESVVGFWGCTNLTSVVIPNSVKTIDSEAFYECTSLKSVVIPNSVEHIRSGAFRDCSSLTSIELPSSLLELYNSPFSGCSSLTSLIIPKSVTQINSNPVAGCSSLTSLTIEDGNINYDSRDNCNAIIETFSNKLIGGCKNTIIPNSVKSLGPGAFSGCGLTVIIIPNSVTSISEGAFWGCTGLKEVFSYIVEPFEIGEDVFWMNNDGSFSTATLYVPAGSKAKYEATPAWNLFQNIVEMTPTHIQNINQDTVDNAYVFSLSGQRLEAPKKGINIIGGKKIIVK